MSWLKELKAKLDKEKAELAAEATQKVTPGFDYQARMRQNAIGAQRKYFAELEGKPCYLTSERMHASLGAFRSGVVENVVHLYAGDNLLGTITCRTFREERCEGHGSFVTTDSYFNRYDIKLFLPTELAFGYMRETEYLDRIGYYLLQFMEP